AITDFAIFVRRLRARIGILPLPELLDEVLEASGYRAMLADGSEEGEERWANLLELREVTTRYEDLSPTDALDRLLEETALVADQDSYEGEGAAGPLDLDLVFGRNRGGRLVGGVRVGGGAYRQGSGQPGAPTDGQFRPSRDLAARRDAFAGGARSGSLGPQAGPPISDPWD